MKRHIEKPLESFNPFAYPARPLDKDARFIPPCYEEVLDWMQRIGFRSASLDYWARGNYARRIVHHQETGLRPLLVPVTTVEEMRWAYRRLALLDQPVEFLWEGGLTQPLKVLHLHPADSNDMWDAGWGYIAGLGTRVTHRGKLWSPVLGYARLMPETVPKWIVSEFPEHFKQGKLFVAPAELVGVPSSSDELGTAFETLIGAVPLHTTPAADSILQMQLPVLDNLKPDQFTRFLKDNSIELERLRFAFRKLIASHTTTDIKSIVEELNYETSELTLSERYHSFRTRVIRLGGVVGTTSAAIGAAVGAATGSITAAVVAAAGGVAAAGLCECFRESAEHNLSLRQNPFYILWSLGSQSGKPIGVKDPLLHKHQKRSAAPRNTGDGYFHWLAPPRPGVKFLSAREVK